MSTVAIITLVITTLITTVIGALSRTAVQEKLTKTLNRQKKMRALARVSSNPYMQANAQLVHYLRPGTDTPIYEGWSILEISLGSVKLISPDRSQVVDVTCMEWEAAETPVYRKSLEL